ncbi:TRAP transporter large permease [Elioraea tepida]|uniref:TRAP transporter large permease protein n=1 Tax=Elioraea tepida TaxID=2843330 RepID=A0A975U3N6_9PROT|nr:TRAP transporter large permease [Elioraea tepida]QXM24783.1 TRAP transporter large permease [Elioraea tepida]
MSGFGVTQAAIGFAIMLGLMGLGVHVAVAMAAVALLGAALYLGEPVINALGTQIWAATDSFTLLAVPLFVLMGELLVKGGITDRIYRALALWLGPLPGGLLHTNIGASAIFAAVSGSSVATAATIGTVALPAFADRRYDQRLVLGSIAGGATLGILIPPSINMIIYGAMTNTSVGRLYAAGVVPGLLLMAMFMAVTAVLCRLRPALAGGREPLTPLSVRLRGIVDLAPPLALFIVVMGSIYAGWATPTESAAVGVVAALVLALAQGRLTLRLVASACETTVSVTAMIVLIVAAAFYLNFVLGILGVPQALTRFVTSLGLDSTAFLIVLVAFYLVLGCFLETLSMMVGTIPIVFPIVTAYGIDPVWFGIFLVMMCEMALITPPVGMNLYVVQGVRGGGSVGDVIVGALPYLAMLALLTALLMIFPGIALWLPRLAFA